MDSSGQKGQPPPENKRFCFATKSGRYVFAYIIRQTGLEDKILSIKRVFIYKIKV
jgi:hypothetical protein